MAEAWRLLLDGPAPGPWNMGVDEALLASAARGGPATLRLYRWQGPWLSLGYGQALAPERRTRCAAAGVGWVRRATGGRAVLHGADLTYAVAAPEAALPAGLRPTYEKLAEALLRALRSLGVVAERSAAARAPATRAFDCFADSAPDELCVAGAKLVGSAQRRAGGAVLQHGSLRLGRDPASAREASGLDGAGATSLAELGCPHDVERVQQALVEAFAATLQLHFEPGALSPAERRLASVRAEDPIGPAQPLTPGESQGPHPEADRY